MRGVTVEERGGAQRHLLRNSNEDGGVRQEVTPERGVARVASGGGERINARSAETRGQFCYGRRPDGTCLAGIREKQAEDFGSATVGAS